MVDLRSFPMFDSETGRITGAIEYVRDGTDSITKEHSLLLFTNLLISRLMRYSLPTLRRAGF